MSPAKMFNFLSMVGLCAAAVVSVNPGYGAALLDPAFEASRLAVLGEEPHLAIWNFFKNDIEGLAPGIECNLVTNTTTKRLAPNEDCLAIEEGLRPLFPDIQCEGRIEWSLLDTPFTGNLVTRKPDLEARRTNAEIDHHHSQNVAEVARLEHKTITDCASANRPGNCRLCVAGFAVAAVSEIGVCGAAAYGATFISAGIAAPAAWAAFLACGAAALANLGANLTGCWSR